MSRVALVFGSLLRKSFRVSVSLWSLLLTASGGALAAPVVLPQPDLQVLSEGSISSIEIQPDGKMILGGTFQTVDGQVQENLARLNQDGSLDKTFVPEGANGQVRLMIYAGQVLVVGGQFTQIGGKSHVGLAEIDTDTGLPDPLPLDLNSGAMVTALASDETSVYAGGNFTSVNGLPRAGFVKFNAKNGAIDPNWQPSIAVAGKLPSVIAVDPADPNRVYIGGDFTSFGGQPRQFLVAVDSVTGAPIMAFDAQLDGAVTALQTDGDLYAGGAFHNAGTAANAYLARLDPLTGAARPGFVSPAKGPVTSNLIRDASGNILAVVGPIESTPAGNTAVMLFDPNGNPIATSEAPGLNGPGLALGHNGSKLIAAGTFDHLGPSFLHSMAQFDATTLKLDQVHFGVSNVGTVSAIHAIPDGSWFVAGSFNQVNGGEHRNLALLNPDSTLNNSWKVGIDGSVRVVTADATYVYLAGDITAPFKRLGRIHMGTYVVEPLPPPDTSTVNALFLSNADLYVGGLFNQLGSTPLKNLGKINVENKTVDTLFVPNPDDQVNNVIEGFPGAPNLHVAGRFHNIGGLTRHGVASVSRTTGQGIPAFNANLTFNGQTSSVVVFGAAFGEGQGTQPLFAVGGFNAASGQTHSAIVALDLITGQPVPGFNGQLTSIPRVLAAGGHDLFIGLPGGSLAAQPAYLSTVDPLTGALLQNYAVSSGGLPGRVTNIALNPVTGTVMFSGIFDNVDGLDRSTVAGLGSGSLQTVNVAEFFDAVNKHYFVTGNPEEAAALRGNPGLGFSATGGHFNAFGKANYPGPKSAPVLQRSQKAQTADTPTPANPVSRFYGSVTPGPNSHLYVANAAEAAGLRALEYVQPDNQPRWNFEEIAFAINLPDAAGNCPASAPVPVYRAYNNRALQADANHRMTTDFAAYSQMASLGWILEGVVMCALP